MLAHIITIFTDRITSRACLFSAANGLPVQTGGFDLRFFTGENFSTTHFCSVSRSSAYRSVPRKIVQQQQKH